MSNSSPRHRRRPLTLRLKLLLLGLGAFAGLAGLEIALRVAGISYPVPYATDPWCGSRLQSNFGGYWSKEGRASVTTNSLGFRDTEHSLAKPTGTVRVAVLGDSYVEALQVADDIIFARCLEDELAKQLPVDVGPIEVLSFGVSGWGTAQELQALRHYVWQFDPDVVLLAFLPGNDVRNNSKPLEPMQCRPFFKMQDHALILDDAFLKHPDYLISNRVSTHRKNRVINSSRIIQLGRALRDTAAEANQETATDADIKKQSGGAKVEDGLEETAMVAPQAGDWIQAWELTDRLIQQMAEDVQQRQRMFAVMTIPAAVQVDPDPAVRAAMQRQLQVTDLEYAERRVSDLASHFNFLHILLAEKLRTTAEREKSYLHGFSNTRLGTGHWNENGHREAAKVAAASLAPVLMSR